MKYLRLLSPYERGKFQGAEKLSQRMWQDTSYMQTFEASLYVHIILKNVVYPKINKEVVDNKVVTYTLNNVILLSYKGASDLKLASRLSYWVRSINFTTQLLLGLGLDLVLLASSTNVQSGPRFAKICSDVFHNAWAPLDQGQSKWKKVLKYCIKHYNYIFSWSPFYGGQLTTFYAKILETWIFSK